MKIDPDHFPPQKQWKILQDLSNRSAVYKIQLPGGKIYIVKKIQQDVPKKRLINPLRKKAGARLTGLSNELNILKKIHHANIVSYVSTYVNKETKSNDTYLVTEAFGAKLEDLPTQSYPAIKVLSWIQQLSSAVAYLHSNGIIHRDIKPSNILLDADFNLIKLCDFGSALCYEDIQEKVSRDKIVIVDNVGTAYYISPEIASWYLVNHVSSEKREISEVMGEPVDVWAIGVVCYVLIFGKLPFKSESTSTLYHDIVYDAIEIPQTFAEQDVDETMCGYIINVLNNTLKKDPSLRVSAGNLNKFLLEVLA